MLRESLNELNRRALSGTVSNGEGAPEGERAVPSDPIDRLGEAEEFPKSLLTPLGPEESRSPTMPPNSQSADTENVSTDSRSKSYAEQVDQTLSLLSDESNRAD